MRLRHSVSRVALLGVVGVLCAISGFMSSAALSAENATPPASLIAAMTVPQQTVRRGERVTIRARLAAPARVTAQLIRRGDTKAIRAVTRRVRAGWSVFHVSTPVNAPVGRYVAHVTAIGDTGADASHSVAIRIR